MRWGESYSYGICRLRLYTDGGFKSVGSHRGSLAGDGTTDVLVPRPLRYICP